MEQEDSFLYRLSKLDPAVFRGIIVGIVTILADVGVVIAPGIPDALVGVITAVAVISQALWTRNGVTPNAKVAVMVPDPYNEPHIVAPGEAVTTATPKEIVAAAEASPAAAPSPASG